MKIRQNRAESDVVDQYGKNRRIWVERHGWSSSR